MVARHGAGRDNGRPELRIRLGDWVCIEEVFPERRLVWWCRIEHRPYFQIESSTIKGYTTRERIPEGNCKVEPTPGIRRWDSQPDAKL
jgi:hypothetical protein